MGGATFTHSFDSLGEINYFCLVHPWMIGKITVGESDTKTEKTPIEYVYQATLTAAIDLPPSDIENAVSKYQEKFEIINERLTQYQLEEKSNRQGNVYFNPSYWSPSLGSLFTAQTQILIDVSYDNLEDVLIAVKDSGVNFESFSMRHSPDVINKMRKDLTQKAIENARDRALEITGPMNLKIKGIKSIEVKSGNVGNPYGGQQFYSYGVMIQPPYYDNQQVSEASVLVEVEFEVGK